MTERSDVIQGLLDAIAEAGGISYDFIAASEHPYRCTCDSCRSWWLDMGPDEDNRGRLTFGPFGDELWAEYAAHHHVTVEEAKSWFEETDGDE